MTTLVLVLFVLVAIAQTIWMARIETRIGEIEERINRLGERTR